MLKNKEGNDEKWHDMKNDDFTDNYVLYRISWNRISINIGLSLLSLYFVW